MKRLVMVCLISVFAACAADSDSPTPTLEPIPDPTPTQTPFVLEEQEPEAFVTDFMDARVRGDRGTAELHLSSEAARQFEQGADGLRLVDGFQGWELISLEAIDASSFEVQVRIQDADGSFVEFLFVGSGTDQEGQQSNLIVRGAGRA